MKRHEWRETEINFRIFYYVSLGFVYSFLDALAILTWIDFGFRISGLGRLIHHRLMWITVGPLEDGIVEF